MIAEGNSSSHSFHAKQETATHGVGHELTSPPDTEIISNCRDTLDSKPDRAIFSPDGPQGALNFCILDRRLFLSWVTNSTFRSGNGPHPVVPGLDQYSASATRGVLDQATEERARSFLRCSCPNRIGRIGKRDTSKNRDVRGRPRSRPMGSSIYRDHSCVSGGR
jgi:hypothetical protein